jgi:hypothetical protein
VGGEQFFNRLLVRLKVRTVGDFHNRAEIGAGPLMPELVDTTDSLIPGPTGQLLAKIAHREVFVDRNIDQ